MVSVYLTTFLDFIIILIEIRWRDVWRIRITQHLSSLLIIELKNIWHLTILTQKKARGNNGANFRGAKTLAHCDVIQHGRPDVTLR